MVAPRPRRAAQIGALLLVSVAPTAVAQSLACADALATAEREYREQVYAAVEPLVLDCVYDPGATPDERVAGYRLLALSFIKQDRLADAREAIVKLLGVDYTYEADLETDLPLYVGLVDATREQLRIAPGASVGGGGEPDRALVDVNTATAEALEAVPGIGPVLAGRIVAYRAQHGPFQSVAELEAVRGIGPRTLERLAPHLRAVQGTTLQAVAGGGGAPAPVPPAELIDLNTATAEVLDTLDGIGPTLAARIVEFRATHGPFRSVEDVMLVRGIGPRTLEGFAHRVTVE